MQDYADMPMDYENWDSIDDVFFIMQMLSEFEGPRTKDGSPNVPTEKFLVCLKKDSEFWEEITPILIDEKRLTRESANDPKNDKIIEGERNRILDFFKTYYHITPGCDDSEKKRAWADFHRRFQGNRGMQELIALDKRLFPCICAKFPDPRKYTNNILKLLITNPNELAKVYQKSEDIGMRRILRNALFLYYEKILKKAYGISIEKRRKKSVKKNPSTEIYFRNRKYEEDLICVIRLFEYALDTVDVRKSKFLTWTVNLIDRRIFDYIKKEIHNYNDVVALEISTRRFGERELSEAKMIEAKEAHSRMLCNIQKEHARKCIEFIKQKLAVDIENQRRPVKSRDADAKTLKYINLEKEAIETAERECAELEIRSRRIKNNDFAKALGVSDRHLRNIRQDIRKIANKININDQLLSYDLGEGEDDDYGYLYPPKRRRKKAE